MKQIQKAFESLSYKKRLIFNFKLKKFNTLNVRSRQSNLRTRNKIGRTNNIKFAM